jgi:hypothetical protein
VRLAQVVAGIIIVALMVQFGFGVAVLLLLLLAASYVIGALALLIKVRAKRRIAERPVSLDSSAL